MPYNVHGDLVKTLAHNVTTLRALIQGLPAEVIEKQGVGTEKWSILEVVCHLRDTEKHAFDQVRLMVEEDRPCLNSFDAERVAEESDYQSQPLRKTLDAFLRTRDEQIAYLQKLPDEEWNQTGEHEEEGEITVLNLTIHMAAHDSIHLAQISSRILETRGQAASSESATQAPGQE